MDEVFYDDIHRTISYNGSWARMYGSIYRQTTIHRTRKMGDSAQFKFNGKLHHRSLVKFIQVAGTSIAFLGVQGWDHGAFIVDLDGIETTVDGHCCGRSGGIPQVVQFEANNLSPTVEHTITITNAEKGPYGNVFEVDGFL